jgi:beta-galactosidase
MKSFQMKKILPLVLAAHFVFLAVSAQQAHQFRFAGREFMLDGKPFQIISGEMHPARIPREYWRQRIQMAKAMGCNTIAVYVFWNYHESSPGNFDFSTGNRDIAAFIRLCKEEGMWVLLRPGPYVCAEWDWGGLPSYLLKIPDIRIRCMDKRYMSAVRRYVARLSKEIVPLQCIYGGPILMVQVENEYGSYANDRGYLEALRKGWIGQGVKVPFYTADGPTDFMLEAGSLDGCAVGLDSGTGDADWETAYRHHPDVPVFSSESYPGWLTHWKEKWQRPDTAAILGELKYLLEHKRSFNLYVVHGGTNFGFTAGANAFSPVQFQPDVTSYDYDAPVTEQGRASAKYYSIRRLIGQYVKVKLPDIPAPIPTMEIPFFTLSPFSSVWAGLPDPVHSPQPVPMEYLGQKSGLILYRTKLIGHKSGSLTITEPHDYALVFLDGKLVDTIYRDGGHWTIQLPKSDAREPVLEILVESMGHINFAQYMIDRKGITDRVTLNGMTLMNWDIFSLPMDEGVIAGLSAGTGRAQSSGLDAAGAVRGSGQDGVGVRPGIFFKGSFELQQTADTYLDMSNFKKGVIWVNGHNLGRYWYVGPQQRLYCPAGWLKKGRNEVIVFDLQMLEAAAVRGVDRPEGGSAGGR